MDVHLEGSMGAVLGMAGVTWLQDRQREARQLGGKDSGYEIPG